MPIFLTTDDVIEIHDDQINVYGGSESIRDQDSLKSAVFQPKTGTFAGGFLYQNLFEMASVYGFHICQNHPFVDGNKRTAAEAMLTFLKINNITIDAQRGELENVMLMIASSTFTRNELSDWLRDRASSN